MIEPDRELRVLVVDDHRAFADLLGFALSAQPDITCVGIATDVAQGITAAVAAQPDIVMLDIALAEEDGLVAIPQFRQAVPGVRIAVLTAHRGMRWMVQAGQAGASAFIPKDGPLTDVLDVIRRAGTGPMIIARSARSSGYGESDVHATTNLLTRRERDVLDGLGKGQPPKIIARSLGISVQTCRGYLKTLMSKLDTASQLETVVAAQRIGLLRASDDA
jgi:DNA-binding NarL/FixJ family response regulator